MNTFFSHDGLKHTPNVKSAVVIVFPMERAYRRAASRSSDVIISAAEKRPCDVVPLWRDQAAETVDRLLHLRFLQESVFALKLQGKLPPKRAPDERWSGPFPS
jgi:hypothetical protein